MKMMKNMEIIRCSQNKRIVLVGSSESKRTLYFSKAAEKLGYFVECIEWEKLKKNNLTSSAVFVKLDPPSSFGEEIDKLSEFISWYFNELNYLENKEGVMFGGNTPSAIISTIDKVMCKNIMHKNKIDTTDMIDGEIIDYSSFREALSKNNLNRAFIKPRYGSGASGVIAYCRNPKLDDEIIYTSLTERDNGKLYNTKKTFRINEKTKIKSIINKILNQPVIVERWINKAKYNGLSYDIRAVYQYNKLDFMVARASNSPITNLHLNNRAVSIDEIGLKKRETEKIEELCCRASMCFDGLNIAGIDILVTPSRDFKIIEINGQGDLIYQDIFNENKIYERQIREGTKICIKMKKELYLNM